MSVDPVTFYKCLADETRLQCVLLIAREGELCVCELVEATEQSQPKVSRHLAQLRRCGLLQDRRQGQWIFYALSQSLPGWAQQVLHTTQSGNGAYLAVAQQRLARMGSRPERCSA